MARLNGLAGGWNEHLGSLPNARKVNTYTEATNDWYHPFVEKEDWEYDSAYDIVHRGADAGRGYMNEAIEAARKSGADVTQGIAAMRSDAGSMRNQARLVNTQAGAVNAEADALKALIPQLDPYKDRLTNYGDDLAALSATIQGRADDVFGQAGALMNLDPNAGGLAGEYMKQYGLLSPERYVSRYASDAQAAIDNTRAQNERYLSRRGVNIGSGANRNLLDQLQGIVALSAAKTLGYDKGVTEQGNWLKEMTGAAKTFFDMGSEQQSQALSAKGMAGDMAKGAAEIVGMQGDMTKGAGQLRAEAGQLFANAANIFGGAASIEGNAAKLSVDSQDTLVRALSAAAQYYLGSAQAEASAAYSGRNRVFA